MLHVSFFVEIFHVGGFFFDAMDEFLSTDLVADVDEATDLFAASDAGEPEGDSDPLKGFRLRWAKKRKVEEDEIVPSPSLVSSDFLAQNQQQVSEPPLSAATDRDHTTSVTNAFLTGMKPSTIVLPWEQSWLAPIFGDPLAAPSLSMPANWNAQLLDPIVDVFPGVEAQPKEPLVFAVSKCIKNRVDRSFIDERAVQTDKAIAKLKCLLEIELEFSGVGRQLMSEATEQGRSDVLLAILGTRSPGTVIKRVNALLHFYRWFWTQFELEFLPMCENVAWEYIQHLRTSNAAPTKATSFVQALRFGHYILQIDGAEGCINSRRIIGSAELQLAMKSATKQARPLTVAEVRKLHAVTTDQSASLQQRVLASHLLMMLYTRSRTSDLAHVHEVLHDVSAKASSSGAPDFIQISTRYHKAAKSAEKKSLLLPILASSTAVVHDDWLSTWLKLRRQAGLRVAGVFDCNSTSPGP